MHSKAQISKASRPVHRGARLSAAFLSVVVTGLLAAPPDRVPGRVDDSRRVYLNGSVHAKAQAQYDQGPVDPYLQLTHLTLNFSLSPAQQADLDQLLAAQQNRSSRQYHQWLTPEQFGARFGMSDADLDAATAWLKSQGFTVTGTARAKNFVTFDGTAAMVKSSFRTELHHYLINGELNFSNATEPSIPAALQPVVRGIQGLNNFRLKPRIKSRSLTPDYTSRLTGNTLAPDDFATIYDIKALYAQGIDGTGQSLVVSGQTTIVLSDLQHFRTMFNLPGQDPTQVQVPNTGTVPVQTQSGDLEESDLDLEWTSAVARNATIIFVFGQQIQQSWQYAIDQNLAPVMTSSYGGCEQDDGSVYSSQLRAMAQQAVAQGMTWSASAGDSGAADCSGDGTSNAGLLAVDQPASIPEVTGVGGTEFNEGSGTYWNATNNANGQSVLSYIPETSWNDGGTTGTPESGGGGASVFFSKPPWQLGAGVPSDGARDVPDISLDAGVQHDSYLIYTSNTLSPVGGTSAASQVFGGIVTLLNQYLVKNGAQASPGLGNINPTLYNLAQNPSTYASAFHDITTGNNIVTPNCRGRGCPTGPIGFSAGVGYDQATGLGSIDVFNLFVAWNATPGLVTPQISVSASATAVTTSGSAVLTATVTSSNGVTPTGAISFLQGTTTLGTAPLAGSGNTTTATLTIAGSQLSIGANNIAVVYNSDNSTFTNAAATVTITVTNGPGTPTVTGLADGASFGHLYAPGEILSVFGTGLSTSTQSATSVPLPTSLAGVTVTINGVAAPLFAVTPTQINLQIPYETDPSSTATLEVQSNGAVSDFPLNLNATAPAIFTNASGAPVPNTSGNLGNTITLYITGGGAVTPSMADGAAPAAGTSAANLPMPANQPVSVTVGGVNAPVKFEGIAPGLVGVMQINYQLPATGLTQGFQPVVVTVGRASSVAAHLTVLR